MQKVEGLGLFRTKPQQQSSDLKPSHKTRFICLELVSFQRNVEESCTPEQEF